MRLFPSAVVFRLVDWFIPPSLRRATAVHRRAQMYLIAHLFGPPFGFVISAALYFIDPHPGLVLWIVTGGFFAFYIYPAIVKLTGQLTVLAPFSIQHITFLILLASAKYGGVNSPFLGWLGVVPLLAAFYVQGHPMLRAAVLGMTAAQMLVFYGLGLAGIHLTQPVPLEALESAGMLSIFCTCAFVLMMSIYYAGVVSLQQVELEREVEGHRCTETKLRQAMEEAQRAHALQAQLQHSQRLEALGTLAGGIAHEINNALVPVIALTTLVARKLPADSRERRNLETVLGGAERSRDLLKRILSFSRKEEQRQERFDLAVVLRDALGMMRASLPATIRLEQDIVPEAPFDGDPTQLHQAIINLVTNAAQAIGEAMGLIKVRLEHEADRSAFATVRCRYRLRHERGDPRAALRAVLHDQSRRQRYRPRPRDRARHRQGPWRPYRRRNRARPRQPVRHRPADPRRPTRRRAAARPHRRISTLSIPSVSLPKGGRSIQVPLIRLCRNTPLRWEKVWNPISP